MTNDSIEIVNTDKAISIGLDRGSTHACRLYNYYPNRVTRWSC
jgi:hypothetical protein